MANHHFQAKPISQLDPALQPQPISQLDPALGPAQAEPAGPEA